MMRFELGLERSQPWQASKSATTIGLSYAIGGLIPLSTYFFIHDAYRALVISAVLTLTALLVFGYIKGRYTGSRLIRDSLQTILIGGAAATTAFAVARFLA